MEDLFAQKDVSVNESYSLLISAKILYLLLLPQKTGWVTLLHLIQGYSDQGPQGSSTADFPAFLYLGAKPLTNQNQ